MSAQLPQPVSKKQIPPLQQEGNPITSNENTPQAPFQYSLIATKMGDFTQGSVQLGIDSVKIFTGSAIPFLYQKYPNFQRELEKVKPYFPIIIKGGAGLILIHTFWKNRLIFSLSALFGFAFSIQGISNSYFPSLQKGSLFQGNEKEGMYVIITSSFVFRKAVRSLFLGLVLGNFLCHQGNLNTYKNKISTLIKNQDLLQKITNFFQNASQQKDQELSNLKT